MSERWIKVTHELGRKREVLEIGRRLNLPREFRAHVCVGALISVWCLFDEQTTDGLLVGYTVEDLDHHAGIAGLGDAMISVGWLEVTADGVRMPHFDEHTSASAKARASDSRRKRLARRDVSTQPDKCPKASGHSPGPEEKRGEENRKEPGTARHARSTTEPSRADSLEKQNAEPPVTWNDLFKRRSDLLNEFVGLTIPRCEDPDQQITGGIWTTDVEKRLLRGASFTGDSLAWSLKWFQLQITAASPMFAGAAASDALLVVATAYAIKSAPSVASATRWARWSTAIKRRDASLITDQHLAAAAELLRKKLQKQPA